MTKARKYPVLALLLAVAVAALAVLPFVFPTGDTGQTGMLMRPEWLSHTAAFVIIAVTALSLGYVNSNCFLFASDSRLLYLPYLLTVLMLPGVTVLTPAHIPALLFVWCIFYTLKYVNSENHRLYYLFVAALTSSTVSLIIPQMLAVCVFVLLYCIYTRGQDLLRMCMTYLSAAVLPWIYLAAWKYLSGDGTMADYLTWFGQALVPRRPVFSEMSTGTLVYAGFMFLLCLRSLVFTVSRGRERNKAQKNSFGLSVALSVVVFIIWSAAGGHLSHLFWITAAVPLSFTVFDFLSGGRSVEVRIFLTVLLVLTAALRFLEYFPFI